MPPEIVLAISDRPGIFRAMLTRVEISNYRSFLKAEANLSPFTLVIGANGSGKSNFLRFFRDINTLSPSGYRAPDGGHPGNPSLLAPHFDHLDKPTRWKILRGDLPALVADGNARTDIPFPGQPCDIYSLVPSQVSQPEPVGNALVVRPDGSGIINLLDALKTGVREELFDAIADSLIQFVPDVKRIGMTSVGNSIKGLQFQYEGMKAPVPGHLASDGTRILLAILAIIHQQSPPPLLLIEDIDHSLHPRLFEDFISVLRDVAAERDVQIIATTHNPYLLDCFQEDSDAVLLVEKADGASNVRTLGTEIRKLREHGGVPMALSKLYLSGFLSPA